MKELIDPKKTTTDLDRFWSTFSWIEHFNFWKNRALK